MLAEHFKRISLQPAYEELKLDAVQSQIKAGGEFSLPRGIVINADGSCGGGPRSLPEIETMKRWVCRLTYRLQPT